MQHVIWITGIAAILAVCWMRFAEIGRADGLKQACAEAKAERQAIMDKIDGLAGKAESMDKKLDALLRIATAPQAFELDQAK